jgi:hypothetical protein
VDRFRRMSLGLAVIVGAVFLLSGPALSDSKGKGKKDLVEMSKTAKVTVEQAIKTAQEKVQGKVVEAELERKHDRLVWEVEIVVAEDRVMEVHIDADTGAAIDVEEKGADKKKARKGKKD